MSGIGQDIGENELHRVEAELSELSFSQLFSPDAIYQCSIRGCVDDMRDILLLCDDVKKKEMMEWTDEHERTALIVATQEGFYDCVKLLLTSGANVHHACRFRPGGTALHLAVFYRRSRKIIKQLVLFGADPFVENARGSTPWDISLINGHTCSIEFANFAMFEGLCYVKSSKGFPTTSRSRAFWVRVIPRYSSPERSHEKHLIGIRLCIHWRLLGEKICEIDLEGCKAEIISDEREDEYYVLLGCPADKVLEYNADMLGGCRTFPLTYLWFAGQRKMLNGLVTLLNDFEASAQKCSSDDEEWDDGSSLSLSDTEFSLDDFLGDSSSAELSPAATSVDTTERSCLPRGLRGNTQLDSFKHRHVKSRGKRSFTGRSADVFLGFLSERTESTQKWSLHNPTFMDDRDVCVICLDRPKSVGFVHGKSMHICCCESCGQSLSQSTNRCPLCREAIQHIVYDIF